MRIEDFRQEASDGWARIAARVTWEVRAQAPQELYFAVPEDRAESLEPCAEAFTAACLMPAVRHGEENVAVKAPLCPVFIDNVLTNLDFFRRWFTPDWRSVSIQTSVKKEAAPSGAPGPYGMLLSGGIDSLHAFQRRQELLPADHPARIRKCFMIDYDLCRRSETHLKRPFTEAYLAVFDRHLALLGEALAPAGAEIVPVRTNVVALDDDGRFWIERFHGAAMAGVAHAVGRGLAAMVFASGDIPLMLPYGSHPLTDPRWSSHRLRIEHDTMRHSRLQKTAAVAQWELGLKALRVCISRKSEDLNCGRCEKCLRTMLMLLCLGKLAAAPFPKQDLTRDEVARIEIDEPYQFRQYGQMLPALQQIGRHDLHGLIDGKLQAYRSRAAS